MIGNLPQNESQIFLSQTDPVLAKIIDCLPVPHFESTHDLFHDLMSCLIEQQIHYRSTKKTFEKLLLQAQIDRLSTLNFHIFEKNALINAKLSIQKMETITAVLLFWEENKINWQQCTDAEIKEHLSTIKGIGSWTIDMLLLFTLERPNVFPADDFHLKQVMTELYNLNPNIKLKSQMIAISDTWGEHKSLAVRYLLEWKKANKKQI